MAKIYRLTDRIKLKIGEVEVQISPLTLEQKAEITETVKDGKKATDIMRGSALATKYALKSIKGIEDSDGSEYEPVFDENGNLSDETIDELFNLSISNKLNAICLNLINNIPDEFIDPLSGKKLDGVTFITEGDSPRKKKKAVSGT